MALEETSLYQEFQEIVESGSKEVHHYWTCEIDNGEETLQAYKVLSIDFERDYDKVYSDIVQLEVTLPKGQYFQKIIPFKDDLRVTLKSDPISEVVGESDFSSDPRTVVMRGVLKNDDNPVIEGNNEQNLNESVADLSGFVTVEFQLLDLALEQIRMKTLGGIFREAVPADVLRALMGVACEDISTDNDARIRGIDLAEPSNTEPRNHVIIPHGTKLTSLPSFIQNKCGGVYSSGLGHYLQNGIWYVYPEFDITRFETTPRTLSIINVPPNKFPGIERTYLKDGDKLMVLSTGRAKLHDDSEELQLNYGNGVRFANADKLLGSYTSTSGNVTTVSREENTAEYLASQRRTGLNNVLFSDERITSNGYVQTSRLARRSGSHFEILWENSDPNLLYPGMPVKVLYEASGEVVERYGVLLRAHTYIAAVGTGASISRHKSITNLVLFIERV